MKTPKIVLAGGSGYLGQMLARRFAMWDHEVVVLSRRPHVCNYSRVVRWDGETLGDWAAELESATAVINLSGRSVNCRYTARNRAEILNSRMRSTRVIGEAIAAAANPPAAWLNMSTATLYKHTYGEPHDESGEIGSTPEAKDAFSIEVGRAWERAFEEAETPDTRKALLRTGMVLRDTPESVYGVLRRLAGLGLGGPMAGGRQFVSWIHWIDFCCAVEWLVANRDAEGVYNVTSPNPVTNAELMAQVRDAVGARIGVPSARWMLEVGGFFMRTEAELIVKSRNVIPGRLLSEGFRFSYAELGDFFASVADERRDPRSRNAATRARIV